MVLGSDDSVETVSALRTWRLPNLRRVAIDFGLYGAMSGRHESQHAVFEGPLLTNVVNAQLAGAQTEMIADAFANAPTQKLQHLAVFGSSSDYWLTQLTRTKHLPSLTSLAVLGNGSSIDTLYHFFASPLMRQLTRLSLVIIEWFSNALVALAESPNAVQLQELRVDVKFGLADRTARAIANSPYLKNLRYLHLSSSIIPDEGIKLIQAAHPNCYVDCGGTCPDRESPQKDSLQ
jgi:hypothetical protein